MSETKNERSPLELNKTYLHYNRLIWQVPSWGSAIAVAIIVAAYQITDDENTRTALPVPFIRSCILFFGAFLLIALSIALCKYRMYQAACFPKGQPKGQPQPPFGWPPEANRYLQLAVCLTAGIMLGLALAELFNAASPPLALSILFEITLVLLALALVEIRHALTQIGIKIVWLNFMHTRFQLALMLFGFALVLCGLTLLSFKLTLVHFGIASVLSGLALGMMACILFEDLNTYAKAQIDGNTSAEPGLRLQLLRRVPRWISGPLGFAWPSSTGTEDAETDSSAEHETEDGRTSPDEGASTIEGN